MAHDKPKKPKDKPKKPKDKPKGTRLSGEGGEVIAITVTVNGNLEFYRAAVVTGLDHGNVRAYLTDDGVTIIHNRDTGAKELARKLLTK